VVCVCAVALHLEFLVHSRLPDLLCFSSFVFFRHPDGELHPVPQLPACGPWHHCPWRAAFVLGHPSGSMYVGGGGCLFCA
jgi:hypothetical protein